MVYCGKPSLGCQDCRQRKTRCDRIPLPQGCTQCAKAKRVCVGYRTLDEVRFRHESDNVIRKVKAKEAREKNASSLSTGSTPRSSSIGDGGNGTGSGVFWGLDVARHHSSEYAPDIHNPLMPTMEEQAFGFFVANYVISVRGPSRGHLDTLPELYQTQRVGQCLDASIAAVGLASYSHAVRAPALMQNAQRQYLKAIQLTNKALRSPKDVRKDSTLMSIMVLGMFETVTGANRKSLKNWADHIQGATAVINLRGSQGVQTPAGRRMLFQVVSSLLTHCISRGVPVPDFVHKLFDEANAQLADPSPTLLVEKMMIKYASLNASILDGSCFEPKVIITRALELEGILLEHFTNPQPGWQYETFLTDIECDMIYNGRYHVYFDCWVAQVWNSMRVLRVLLNETIRDALLKGFSSKPPLFSEPEYTAQFQKSTDLLYELQLDILATVPQHLGLVSPSSSAFPRIDSVKNDPSTFKINLGVSSDPSSVSKSLPLSGGLFLMWPLWFAGIMDISDESVRQFVVNNLKTVGHSTGIQQAFILAATVERHTSVLSW